MIIRVNSMPIGPSALRISRAYCRTYRRFQADFTEKSSPESLPPILIFDFFLTHFTCRSVALYVNHLFAVRPSSNFPVIHQPIVSVAFIYKNDTACLTGAGEISRSPATDLTLLRHLDSRWPKRRFFRSTSPPVRVARDIARTRFLAARKKALFVGKQEGLSPS